jgi:hypothetical protein
MLNTYQRFKIPIKDFSILTLADNLEKVKPAAPRRAFG